MYCVSVSCQKLGITSPFLEKEKQDQWSRKSLGFQLIA